jgi:hypothetical protein
MSIKDDVRSAVDAIAAAAELKARAEAAEAEAEARAERFRAALRDSVARLNTGAGMTPAASDEFHCLAPQEIGHCVTALRLERDAALAKIASAERVVEALPDCAVWTKGSGGHRTFRPCPSARKATHADDGDAVHWCCDEHVPSAHTDEYSEVDWADALRAHEESSGSGAERPKAKPVPEPAGDYPQRRDRLDLISDLRNELEEDADEVVAP